MDADELVDVSRLSKHHPVPLAGDLGVQQVGDGTLILDVPLILQSRGELVVCRMNVRVASNAEQVVHVDADNEELIPRPISGVERVTVRWKTQESWWQGTSSWLRNHGNMVRCQRLPACAIPYTGFSIRQTRGRLS